MSCVRGERRVYHIRVHEAYARVGWIRVLCYQQCSWNSNDGLCVLLFQPDYGCLRLVNDENFAGNRLVFLDAVSGYHRIH